MHVFARDVSMHPSTTCYLYCMALPGTTRGDVPAVLCACKYYQLPILHGFARDAVHVRFFRMQILSPRSGTFRKFLMKPHVTHSIPLAYDFHRHEVTYIAAELFLTYRSTPISKEIIVSHHTRHYNPRFVFFFTSFFIAVYIQERFILQSGWYYKETFLSLDFIKILLMLQKNRIGKCLFFFLHNKKSRENINMQYQRDMT